MGRLHEIRLKSDAFIASINYYKHQSIMDVEDSLLAINKSQLLNNKDSQESPLIHKLTGSEYLTNQYARIAGKLKPNLFFSGAFQKEMFLQINENEDSFFIDSYHWLNGILASNYGNNIYGISATNQPKAKQLTLKSFAAKYKSYVLK